jgi:hypothetical protein
VAAFLANVGVNASHAARSPLFRDGSFLLLPIPERHPWRRPMLRLEDLPGLTEYAPSAWRLRAVHLDPDLCGFRPTYGDNCRRAGRAFSLRRAVPGDVIVFVARLVPPATPPAFYLAGCLYIEDVLADVTSDPGPGWWDDNAHIRRARALRTWDSFWVFKGGRGSRRFRCAHRFGRREAETVFGVGWRWRTNRTDMQTIASYTRAVRRVEGDGERWLRTTSRS